MKRIGIVTFLALRLLAQNSVLRQGASPVGEVDFSSAKTTRPVRSGGVLPSACVDNELYFLTNVGLHQCVKGKFAALGNGGTWGTLGGAIAAQSDLWNTLQGKQPLLKGAQSQYVRGDGSLGTLSTDFLSTDTSIVRSGSSYINPTWVQFSAPAAGSTARTVSSRLSDTYSIKDFGAIGDGATDATLAIQNAINGTPEGGTLYIPEGKYLLSGSGAQLLLIDHSMTIRCAGWGNTQLLVSSSVPNSTDVIRLHGPGALIGNVINSCALVPQSGTPARYGINLDATSTVNGSNQISYFEISRNKIGPFGAAAVASTFPPPFLDGVFNGLIMDNILTNGVRADRMGDTVHIEHNTITGTAPGIYLNSVNGANSNTIINNAIVSCAPAILIDYALRPLIEGNNIEPNSTCAMPPNKAMIDITGAISQVVSAEIVNNSLMVQVGTAQYGVRIDNASWTFLDNMYGAGNASQVGYKVLSTAKNTRIVMHRLVGSTPSQTMIDNASTTTSIQDLTTGIWRLVTPGWFYNDADGAATSVNISAGNGQGSTSLLSIYKTPRGLFAFTGTGLNDFSSGGAGVLAADATFCAVVDSTGAQDTFKYGLDGCLTFPSIGIPMPLNGTRFSVPEVPGVSIGWTSSTGHTLGDRWTVQLNAKATKDILFNVASGGSTLIANQQYYGGITASGAATPLMSLDSSNNLVLGSSNAAVSTGVVAFQSNGNWLGRFTGTGGLIVGATNTPDPGAGNIRASGLAGGGNSYVYADVNGKLLRGSLWVPSTTSLLKGDGSGGVAAATASDVATLAGSNSSPAMNGVAAAGTGSSYSRADHVHPADTSRAPVGDVSSSGTVVRINGASVATSQAIVGTNAFGQLVAGPTLPLSPANGGLGVAMNVPPQLRFLGDGSDGAINCTSGNTVSGVKYATTFTVAVGNTCPVNVVNAPLTVYATGACTIAGTLNSRGVDGGSTGFGDFGGSGGGGGGGTAAGAAGLASGTYFNHAYIAAGSGGASSGGAGGTSGIQNVNLQRAAWGGLGAGLFMGGAKGGQGGSSGGAGGLGGQAVVLVCASINFTGTIDVSGAPGGASTGNNIGAGGGGGAGYVWLIGCDSVVNTGTIVAAGGSGGSCGAYTTCGVGGAGGAGWSKVAVMQ